MARADRILFVIDAAADPEARSYQSERPRLPRGVPVTLLFNKVDLCGPAAAGGESLDATARSVGFECLRLSAQTGEGLEGLRSHLKAAMGVAQLSEGGALSARARHLEALEQCGKHLAGARQLLEPRAGLELVAEELRLAQRALGEILGQEGSEELLGRIFASFCIGK